MGGKDERVGIVQTEGKFPLVCNFLPLSQETKFSTCGDKFYEGQFLATKKTLTVSRGTLTNAKRNLAQNGS